MSSINIMLSIIVITISFQFYLLFVLIRRSNNHKILIHMLCDILIKYSKIILSTDKDIEQVMKTFIQKNKLN